MMDKRHLLWIIDTCYASVRMHQSNIISLCEHGYACACTCHSHKMARKWTLVTAVQVHVYVLCDNT